MITSIDAGKKHLVRFNNFHDKNTQQTRNRKELLQRNKGHVWKPEPTLYSVMKGWKISSNQEKG